jgi:hypothetical protein
LRAGLVAAGLAACFVGLAGADGGLLWVVAGVWTVRSVWRSPPGYAWGVLCLCAGARWGTLSLGDVETAARIFGPTPGPVVVRAGMILAVGAAVLSEARIDGLRSASWATRAAALAAALCVVAVAVAPGPGRTSVRPSLISWTVAGVVLVAATLALSVVARRLPAWVPGLAAAVGITIVLTVS